MTTIQLPKELVNKYTILSIKLGKKRKDVIKEALIEFLKANE